MSKVKLIVRDRSHLNDGEVIDFIHGLTAKEDGLRVPEYLTITGIIRTGFDSLADGTTQSSDDIDPVVYIDNINHLTGKLLTLIDATFTDVDQRKAMKEIFKQEIWSWYGSMNDQNMLPWRRSKETKESE